MGLMYVPKDLPCRGLAEAGDAESVCNVKYAAEVTEEQILVQKMGDARKETLSL